MVEVYNPLCVMIILEKKKLRLELVQLNTERITMIKVFFLKIFKIHIRVMLIILNNIWYLNLVIMLS